MTGHSFPKDERLCSRKIIEKVFSKENTASASRYPLLAIWLYTSLPSESPAQVLFSVPARKFRKAVIRNRIRRQMREVYRLHKKLLYDSLILQRLQCAVVIVYTAHEPLAYDRIESALQELLAKIVRHAEQRH